MFSLDSEKDYDNNIYYFILRALLGGRSLYSKIKVNDGEQRQLVDNIFSKSKKKKKKKKKIYIKINKIILKKNKIKI